MELGLLEVFAIWHQNHVWVCFQNEENEELRLEDWFFEIKEV